MGFAQTTIAAARPASIREDVRLPRREPHFPSPVDWRDEVLYFLLVDRFSDGREAGRPLLDRRRLAEARPAGWRWDAWAESGQGRFQGGTLQGVRSQLPYLERLGVTALWLSPVFKQRAHLDSYHGYGIQDFLEVDPRFGTRADLVALVADAHARGLRVILDIIFNHSGENWVYPADSPGGEFTPRYTTGRYPFGAWRDGAGQRIGAIATADDGVWPRELQDIDDYTRAGSGDLGAGDINDPDAEHKRTDFITLRDLRLVRTRAADRPRALLQVLDRAHRLRRLPDRHAEARLAGGGAQLLRHGARVLRQPRQGELPAGRRDRRRRLRAGPLPRRARRAISTPRSTSARCVRR